MDSLGRCLAVLGTGSDVGKSIVAAAFCRIFARAGVRVAPFKAQNMSNNSWVTAEGGEMGRAQIVQAQAAGVEPHVDMNPVLLKPASDTGSQVVLLGRPLGNTEARDYFHDTDHLFAEARRALERLRSRYELIVMEGAGSCAEVNLRERDFVNMRMAHAADAPVVLVADIDRGGVFGQIVGTLEVLPDADRERVAGFVINRFRGDSSLFDDGIAWLERRTGLPVLGLVPYFHHIEIDSEDGLPLDAVVDPLDGPRPDRINIAAVRLPHISNFTDFGPLEREPAVNFHYLARPRRLEGYDLLVLPGSKNVRFDSDWLRSCGWDRVIADHVASGGRAAGICGGYQILGRIVRDPDGIEGNPGETPGLGLLNVETTLYTRKTLARSGGTWVDGGERIEGYEIHMGATEGLDRARPAVLSITGTDGARTENGRVWGTYFHGLFDSPEFRRGFLARLRPDLADRLRDGDPESAAAFRERQYDLLADHFESHLDTDLLWSLAGLPPRVRR